MTENDKQLYQLTQAVTRIANYIHEILLLVKKDQEESKKRWKYEPNEDGFMGSENRIESE
jgi:basic membrane lipoprotein Med (substrate-binding protein (PBP1-ABC) superfamily)